MVTWSVSRDDKKMVYQGGVNSVPLKCARSLNNTCAKTSYGCNRDEDDWNWREDSGLLTDKSMIRMRFGDTGELRSYNESGYHTLGPLECYELI